MENMPGMEGSDMDHNSHQPEHAFTHMTFFWGKNAEILFSGWPGIRTGMYVLALIVVFVLSVIVEWLSSCQRGKCGNSSSGKIIRTLVHGIRICLGYLVMLAVMSFNVGVLIVAVVGHTLGFLIFGSGVFNKSIDSEKDFPPAMSC